MESNSSAKEMNAWQTPSYRSVQKSALFCANTFVLKPSKSNKLKDPFAMLHSDTGRLSPSSLRMTVISFLIAVCGGEEGSSLGLPSNINNGVIKCAWYLPKRREVLITCTSLYFQRILKRIVNKAPRWHNAVDNS